MLTIALISLACAAAYRFWLAFCAGADADFERAYLFDDLNEQ